MAASFPSASRNSCDPARVDAWPLVTVAFGFVMAMLDVTVVNVALDDIRRDLGISLAGQVWIVDGYTLSFAALLLAGGALATRHGARRAYSAGLALFALASLACAVAPNGPALIAARTLQGVGAALFIPSSLALITAAYPEPRRRARMMGLWSAIVSGSAASGPLVGGIMIAWLGWRAIFWLNVPIGLLGLWLAPRHLVDTPRAQQMLNLAGHACGALALAALAGVLIEGPGAGWSAPVLVAGAVGVSAAFGFAAVQRHTRYPVLPRALLADGGFRRINAIGLLINFGAYGALFLMSLYNAQARHGGPLQTGLNLVPLMLMFTLGNLLAARLLPRHGTALPLRAGLALAAAAALAAVFAAWAQHGATAWSTDAFVALANLGAGTAIPAMTTRVMTVPDARHTNAAAAVLNANRQIGALLGVAVVGIVLHGAGGWGVKLPGGLAAIAGAFALAELLARADD